jgi:hypothetical protein
MEQLGAMEPDQLLQLLLGVIGCAVTMLVLTLVYIVLARRSSRARAGSVGANTTGSARSDDAHAGFRAEGAMVPARSTWEPAVRPTPLDIRARLAGTGRDARQGRGALSRREVLRVSQDPRLGEVWVEVAGVRYSRLSQMRDRAMGERMLSAVTCALRFSGGKVATDEGVIGISLPKCDAIAAPAGFGPLSDADEAGEVMRLVVEGASHQLCIQVADKCYGALADVADKAVAQRILAGISYLLQFSHGRLYANDGVRVVPVPTLTVRPMPERLRSAAPGEEPRRVASSEEDEATLRQLRGQSPAPADDGPGRRASGGGKRRLGRESRNALPSPTLAEQIDTILQHKLESSSLGHVDAQIMARPDGSVRIRVGTKFYERPDEVPDAELRKIIQAAIAEW